MTENGKKKPRSKMMKGKKKNARAHTREKSTYKANYPEYHI